LNIEVLTVVQYINGYVNQQLHKLRFYNLQLPYICFGHKVTIIRGFVRTYVHFTSHSPLFIKLCVGVIFLYTVHNTVHCFTDVLGFFHCTAMVGTVEFFRCTAMVDDVVSIPMVRR
jgi:hypothetical protein